MFDCRTDSVTGQKNPGTYPLVTYPLDTYPLGHIPPVNYPLDTYPLDTYPLGHIPPGHLPPRTYTPQDICPPDFKLPYLVHASCVDFILHFKKHLFCRNSICLRCMCNKAVRYLCPCHMSILISILLGCHGEF